MKCLFRLHGTSYLAPSKKEARKFLRMFGENDWPYRFVTTWKIKHIERAPSYGQFIRIMGEDKVEFNQV